MERNIDHLKKEVLKAKPRVEVVKELIKRTLKSRRETILNGGRPDVFIEDNPHLKKANNYVLFNVLKCVNFDLQLMYEFDLIDGVYITFLENWEKWKSVIVEYSRANQNTPMCYTTLFEVSMYYSRGWLEYRGPD